MSTETKSKDDRKRDAYEKSARALDTANRLKFSNPDKAEVYYDRSAKWLMVYNELTGDKLP
jgi:hypothetical protein